MRTNRSTNQAYNEPHYAAEDGFGPTLKGRHKRVSGRSFFKGIVNVVLAGIVAIVLLGVAVTAYASSRINRETVTGLSNGVNATNILVVGSDSRDGFTPEELAVLGTETVEGQRTDTIFLLSIDGGKAAMLSFPRDLYLTDCEGRNGRINAAYALGGPSCLIETVTANTGIRIDHYVEVNLHGFVQIVDAVGGVPIYLDAPLQDRYAGVDLPPGCHRLDGATAVGFVRARHVDSDLGRIARQQRFLRQLAGEVISTSTFVNLPRLFNVAGSAGDSLTADSGLGVLGLAQLARAVRGLATNGLATYTVPTNAANIGGAAVLLPADGTAELYRSFADGSVLNVPPTPEVAVATPGDVPITVLNGTGRQGLAAQARDFLTARGFTVTEIGNADPVETTVIRHGAGGEAVAGLLSEQLGGASVQSDESTPNLVLVLGPDANLDAPAPPPVEPPPAPSDPGDAPLGAAPVPDECS